MRQRFKHTELCELVELEPDFEDEWRELYREWKQEELKDLWRELKRVEQSYLRRMHNRRNHLEEVLGIRLKTRVPKQVIEPPVHILRQITD